MSQTITDAPAPWRLQGRGYIAAFRDGQGRLDDQAAFVPPSLRGKRRGAPWAYMMFVDYATSPVGPYHELLFIPGAFDFAQGRYLSISRIFVSSEDSVVNGRRNWGIPKELAQFSVQYGQEGVDRVQLSRGGKTFADLCFKPWPLPLPMVGGLVPPRWRTLGQHHEGQEFIYSPLANGIISPASLRDARFDSAEFPDLSQASCMACVKVRRFWMTFPEARIQALNSEAAHAA